MARISASEEQVLRVQAGPERVYAFFSQPEELSRAMTSVERCERLPDGRVRWVLAEKVDKGIRFQADYVVTYDGDGAAHVGWQSVAGNMGNDGDVWIRGLPGGGSEIRYRERVEPDLPITPLMAGLIKPLVARELRGEIHQFLERVRDHFGAEPAQAS